MSIQIIVDSLSEAEQVIEHSDQLIKKYDYLSVADLYDLVGQVSRYDETRVGWTDLEEVTTERTTDGLSTVINFPEPDLLDI